MKKLLLALAAAAFIFSGCEGDDNGGSAQKNTVTFGDSTVELSVNVTAFTQESHVGGPGYHIDADASFGHFFLNFSESCKNKKINVGSFDQSVVYTFECNSPSENDYPFDIHHYNEGGKIDHSSVGTWFKSGTLELKDDGKSIVLDVNAVCQDGRKFIMNITGDRMTSF